MTVFLRHLEDRLIFGGVDDLRNKRVLDAGCGFGFTLVAVACLGAEALGVEIYEPMVQTTRLYMDSLAGEVKDRLSVVHGDVSQLPVRDSSYDVILSFEAISHYRDVKGFIEEAYRVLRPGGVLIVSDGNNLLNPVTRRKTQQVWNAFELGPRGTTIHGRTVLHHYEQERREYIAREFPDIDDRKMAHETFGMTLPEIAAACERCRKDGVFPGSVYDHRTVPLNPEDGTVIERLFDPFVLAREMKEIGFSTRTRGYWGGASGRKGLRVANTFLGAVSRLTMFFARAFWIAARKRG